MREAEEVVVEVFEDEHASLWNRVQQGSDVRASAYSAVDVGADAVVLRDLFENELRGIVAAGAR